MIILTIKLTNYLHAAAETISQVNSLSWGSSQSGYCVSYMAEEGTNKLR